MTKLNLTDDSTDDCGDSKEIMLRCAVSVKMALEDCVSSEGDSDRPLKFVLLVFPEGGPTEANYVSDVHDRAVVTEALTAMAARWEAHTSTKQ